MVGLRLRQGPGVELGLGLGLGFAALVHPEQCEASVWECRTRPRCIL